MIIFQASLELPLPHQAALMQVPIGVFPFTKLKGSQKGHSFDGVPAIQLAVESIEELTAANFQAAFVACKGCW